MFVFDIFSKDSNTAEKGSLKHQAQYFNEGFPQP